MRLMASTETNLIVVVLSSLAAVASRWQSRAGVGATERRQDREGSREGWAVCVALP